MRPRLVHLKGSRLYWSSELAGKSFADWSIISLAISLGVLDISLKPISLFASRLSIWITKASVNPMTLDIHQTQLATKRYWLSLLKDIIFSRAYTITSLSLSKVIVIKCRRMLKVRSCCYKKLMNLNNNRYRYHKNSIINKGLLSLVSFWLFTARACSSIVGDNVISFIVMFKGLRSLRAHTSMPWFRCS